MAENKEVRIDIVGSADGLVAAMQQAASAVKGTTDQIKARFDEVGKVFETLQKSFLALSAVVAGGAFFKEAIGETNKLTGEVTALSKRLGITGEAANTLNTALDEIGSDSETYIGAFDAFARQLKKNEDGLQAMGLQTRDANGNLRDSNTLFTEALQAVGQYKPGLDQTTAAMTFFGKSVDDVMKLQKLNNEELEKARKKNEELGLTITKENVESSKAYKRAMADVRDVLTAVQKTVGEAVMPVFTQLAEWFAEDAPAAIAVFRVAIDTVSTVLQAVVLVVKSVWEAIKALAFPITQFASGINKLIHGDMKGATEELMKIGPGAWGDKWSQAFKKIGEDASKTWTNIKNTWGQGTELPAPKGGTKRMGDLKPQKDKGRMSQWEAELEEAKLAFQEQANEQGSFEQFSKQSERQFWRDRLALTVSGTQENLAVRKKAAEVELNINKDKYETELATLKTEEAGYKYNFNARKEILDKEAALVKQRFGEESKEYQEAQRAIVEAKRQAAEQIKQISTLQVEAERNHQLSAIALQEQQVEIEVQLGLKSRDEQLQALQKFEDQRFEIADAALQERLQAALDDPEQNPVLLQQILNEIEQLEDQHAQRVRKIQADMVKENPLAKTWQSAQQAIQASIQGILNGSMTLRQGLASIWKSISQTITGEISKIITQRVAEFAVERAMALAGISANAAKAGSGAASSASDIPFIGWMMAPLAMASVFTAVMGMQANVPSAPSSAEGGFDIPKFTNPLTQLHAREMVLPAKHADVIRALADGHLQTSAPPPAPPIVLQGRTAGNFFIAHVDDLKKALTFGQRNFIIK